MTRARVWRTSAATAVIVLTALLGAAACAPAGDSAPPATNTQGGGSAGQDADAGDDATTDDTAGDAGFAGAVLAGTGRYAIGADAPFGGYQLSGQPDALPAGCSWSIEGDDGAVVASDELYAFLTDIPEAVTFVTNGCPDWEQFE